MGILISQSGERRDFKKRDFKNIKVILLREFGNLAGGVGRFNQTIFAIHFRKCFRIMCIENGF